MSTQTTLSAANLPSELITIIFSYVHRHDYLACMLVNKHWHSVMLQFSYRHLHFNTFSQFRRFSTLLEETALKRQNPDRISYYSQIEYGALVRSLNLPTEPEYDSIDILQLRNVALHCNNVEAIYNMAAVDNDCYNDLNNGEDFQCENGKAIEVYKLWPRLKHLDLRASDVFDRTLLGNDVAHLRKQIESLDVRDDFRFLSYPTLCLPSLKELRISAHTIEDFVQLHRLLTHCSKTLTTLIINFQSESCQPGFMYLNQALREMSRLKKLAFYCSMGCSLPRIHFDAKVSDIEIAGPCLPELIDALLVLKGLKRLVIKHCHIPFHHVNSILHRNIATLEAFMHTENGIPGVRFWNLAAPINMSSCKKLRCVQATLQDINCEKIQISDVLRNQLEHLHLNGHGLSQQWQQHWAEINKTPWPNMKSIIFEKISLTEAEACHLPLIFPNLEYLYFESISDSDDAFGKLLHIFRQFKYLKGAGQLEIENEYNGKLDIIKQLRQFKYSYNDWAVGRKPGEDEVYPIRCSFQSLPYHY